MRKVIYSMPVSVETRPFQSSIVYLHYLNEQ